MHGRNFILKYPKNKITNYYLSNGAAEMYKTQYSRQTAEKYMRSKRVLFNPQRDAGITPRA